MNKKVIEIEVSESASKPIFYLDKAYIRVRKSNQKLSNRLNLIRNEKLTNTAILLFGLNPQKFGDTIC
jgi:predicted HTH transcriptional regulator